MDANIDSLFLVGDIRDVPSLVQKLCQKADPLSAWLFKQFDPDAQASLQTALNTKENQDQLQSILVENLNRVIKGPLIYDEALFRGIEFKSDTKKLLTKRPEGNDLCYLNRILLEDSYFGELSWEYAEAPKTISGWIFMIPTFWMGVAVSLLSGDGGRKLGKMQKLGGDFGDKHNDKVIGGICSGIASSVTGNVINHDKKN